MSNFNRIFGPLNSPVPMSYLDDNFSQLEAASTSTVSITGAGLIGFLPSGIGAAPTDLQTRGRQIVYLTDFFANGVSGARCVGDGVTNCTGGINAALTAATTVIVPAGTFMTTGGHVATDKVIVGISPAESIIKLSGTNSAATMFVNGVTNVGSPGAWGSGKGFTFRDITIQGNWDGVGAGLASGSYSASANTALLKGVSSSGTNLRNVIIKSAYEHGMLLYRSGYYEMSECNFTGNRGTGLWLEADAAGTSNTFGTYIHNRFELNKGALGGLIMHFTYGLTFINNLFEQNTTYGANLQEGAQCVFMNNFYELNGTAAMLIDTNPWSYIFWNEDWDVVPTFPATRGHLIYDKLSNLKMQLNQNLTVAMTLFKVLSNVGQPAFSKEFDIVRAEASVVDSDDCAATITVQANNWDSTKSRIAFKTNNGTNLADRAHVTELGSFSANFDTAIPAGGTVAKGLLVSSTANFGVFFGSSAPTLSAAKGSLYLRSDGTTTNNRMYVNTDGGTTWTAVTTAA